MLEQNRHILIVDDNESIHGDFKTILAPSATSYNDINELSTDIFTGENGIDTNKENQSINYQIDSAYQGEEAIRMGEKVANYMYELLEDLISVESYISKKKTID